MNNKIKTTTIEIDKELKELMKLCLDRKTYNALKDLFQFIIKKFIKVIAKPKSKI